MTTLAQNDGIYFQMTGNSSKIKRGNLQRDRRLLLNLCPIRLKPNTRPSYTGPRLLYDGTSILNNGNSIGSPMILNGTRHAIGITTSRSANNDFPRQLDETTINVNRLYRLFQINRRRRKPVLYVSTTKTTRNHFRRLIRYFTFSKLINRFPTTTPNRGNVRDIRESIPPILVYPDVTR